MNDSNQIIAIIDNDGRQDIYEIYDDGIYATRKKIISGEKIHFPKSIPGRNAISFIEDDELKMYDRDKRELSSIARRNSAFHYYDWLDSEHVLYTEQHGEHHTDIMSYNIVDHKQRVYKPNASHPSLSYNKQYIAYQQGPAVNIVYIEKVSGEDRRTVRVDEQTLLPYKPSPDGTYLLGSMATYSKTSVVIINVRTNSIKTIIRSLWPEYLEWKG